MIKEGNLVLLWGDENHQYLVKLQKEGKLSTDWGILEHQKIINSDFGSKLKTNTGKIFYVLKPTLENIMMKIKRLSQIVYPKDAAFIIMKSGIGPGCKVVEVGTGSGALTMAFAFFIKPTGKVYSYEKRKDFLENAKANLEKAGLLDYVELKHKEVTSEFDEKEADFIMLDLPEPWKLVEAVRKSLKEGARVGILLPTFNQVEKTVETFLKHGFVNFETWEVLCRKILVRSGRTRPAERMVSHTGYLIFANKVHDDA